MHAYVFASMLGLKYALLRNKSSLVTVNKQRGFNLDFDLLPANISEHVPTSCYHAPYTAMISVHRSTVDGAVRSVRHPG